MSRVVIGEKDAATRRRLEKLLLAEKHDVESVVDGQALLQKVTTEKPDLVLLDIAMPTLDGVQVIEKLRMGGEHIPVVMITTKKEVDTGVQEALRRGATDYIVKPVGRKDLLARVHRALAGSRSRAQLLVPLRELHDPETGRIDAKKIADFLGVPLAKLAEALEANYPTVYKTPAALALQKGLRPIKRCLELISEVTPNLADTRAWLNNAHPDLGGLTPMEVILRGRAGAIVTLLENALAGIPS